MKNGKFLRYFSYTDALTCDVPIVQKRDIDSDQHNFELLTIKSKLETRQKLDVSGKQLSHIA